MTPKYLFLLQNSTPKNKNKNILNIAYLKKKKDWKEMKQKLNSNYLWVMKCDVLNFTLQ